MFYLVAIAGSCRIQGCWRLYSRLSTDICSNIPVSQQSLVYPSLDSTRATCSNGSPLLQSGVEHAWDSSRPKARFDCLVCHLDRCRYASSQYEYARLLGRSAYVLDHPSTGFSRRRSRVLATRHVGRRHANALRRRQQSIPKAARTDHPILCGPLCVLLGISFERKNTSRPLFAQSPLNFASGRSIIQNPASFPRPYEMANCGLEITLPLGAYSHSSHACDLTCAMLDCVHEHETTRPLLRYLQRQYDLDAETLDGFEPRMKRFHQRRQ